MAKVSQFKYVPRPEASRIVHELLQPAIRYTKAECLDLPPVVYERRYVEMSPQQKKYYAVLKNKMIMEAAGEQITAANAAVALNKLLQLSAGCVFTDKQETIHFDISPRYKVLKEVLAETTHKVLIVASYRHVIDLLHTRLNEDGISTKAIHGDVSVAKRTQIFHAFQTTPEPQVLIIQPKTAAHGVTLTAADTVIWWGPTPSLETFIQMNARIDRPGQKHNMTVVQLYSSFAEQHIYQLLTNRIEVHTQIVDLYKKALDN